MRKLTNKQEKFCINYLLNNNATEAAIKAGYSKDTAVVIASQNLTKLNVKERIKELRDKTESAKIMSVQERREMLTLIARFGGKLSIPAIAELNKMGGDYAPIRTDVTSKGEALKSNNFIFTLKFDGNTKSNISETLAISPSEGMLLRDGTLLNNGSVNEVREDNRRDSLADGTGNARSEGEKLLVGGSDIPASKDSLPASQTSTTT